MSRTTFTRHWCTKVSTEGERLTGGYTPGMKTAVSIPDSLFERAEALAQRLGKSRSQVYREALADYVARREPDAVTGSLDEVVDGLGGRADGWSGEAARRLLEQSEW